ncbi:Hypothetical predicted protein [Marmota monax]|uniref:Uncharacterized protein n=1 Tax=Marmota monax TaxID=9995 RepID=A0A5E4C6X3_MARMO|nr:hypothetical protein GHT09_008467 [Marmota monax]VTJ76731.1 Hypothetical predicted protein [Marmota monax]
MVAETSVLSCWKRTKWQHKRKSMLIKYSVKQRRLIKNCKPTDSAHKKRNVLAIRHVSNESKSSNYRFQKKKVFKTFVKTDSLLINNSSSNRARPETKIN